MFYGYDLGNDMMSPTASTTTTTTTTPTSTTANPTPTAAASSSESISTTAPELQVTSAMASSSTGAPEMPTTTTTEATKISTVLPLPVEPKVESAETNTIVNMITTTTPVSVTATTGATDAQNMVATTPSAESTTEAIPSTVTMQESTTATPEAANMPETTTVTDEGAEALASTDATPTEEPTTAAAAELISSFVAEAGAEQFGRIQKARVTRLPSGRLQAPPLAALVSPPASSYLPVSGRSQTNRRPKRHLVGLPRDLETSLFVSLFQPQSQPTLHHQHQQQHFLPPNFARHAAPASSLLGTGHNYLTQTEFQHEDFVTLGAERHYLSESTNAKHLHNTDVISHVFYLGGQQIVHTTFKVYNAVLYYKYFDTLRMSALELELDTPEYNLLLLLPDFNVDMVAAAASLPLGGTLRRMRKELKPRWVQAIIPDFKLDGTMFLTNDLQNLGVCEIFEPNRADLRAMTDEKGIYVKHIEQSINVSIRTRPINQLKRNTGNQQAQPIQISVNHPFLFFIIDRDLEVAVMAGRILNPLNVRIQ